MEHFMNKKDNKNEKSHEITLIESNEYVLSTLNKPVNEMYAIVGRAPLKVVTSMTTLFYTMPLIFRKYE